MSNPGAASTQTSVYVGGGAPVVIGSATTDTIGFYGTTGADQATAITTVTTTAATSSSPYGYGTSTQADAIVTAVNAIIAALAAVGLTA